MTQQPDRPETNRNDAIGTSRLTLLAAVFLLVFGMQFGVPLVQLLHEGPQRWGWQMYSRVPDRVEIVAVSSQGATGPVSLSSVLLRYRFELVFDDAALDQVCTILRDAASLQVRYVDREESVVHECPR